MSDPSKVHGRVAFPVPAELHELYGEFACSICEVVKSGEHYVLRLNFTKPDLCGPPEKELDLVEASEFCRDCWESHAGVVQHWYENEYLEGEDNE